MLSKFGQKILQFARHVTDSVEPNKLGDFTTTVRVLPISFIAVCIGVLSAYVALALLKLINLFTHIFFYQRWETTPISPVGNKLGVWELLVPVVGALIIGVMARYGSEKIRGHGIPEALEAILIRGSRVEPRLAILKPLSSAISIGSGGPFGAEGPIIMTGGAFGSMIAQLFHLTSSERKTLLVAGAAAGMSATFAAPVAAVLLAVELLLFELKPRSFIPVALASATAGAARHFILGPGPLFSVDAHPSFIGLHGLVGCAALGLAAGALSATLTVSVYAAEDFFQRLPLHWMWWPALGGVAIGIGGLICPQALGVGYDVIADLLRGHFLTSAILILMIVKATIWAISLGSGTSGGVLAPLLIMGGCLGGLGALALPNEGAGFWPLIGMGAILGGTMRSPLTGVIFAMELTHDYAALLPLLIAVSVAHGFTVLVLRRSILTEKVSRRGFHVTREYAIDPLEVLFVREVMRTHPAVLPADVSPAEISRSLANDPRGDTRLYPVLANGDRLIGVVTRNDLARWAAQANSQPLAESLSEILRPNPIVAFPDETLRTVVYRMAEKGVTRLLVVERNDEKKLLGKVTLRDLLKARAHHLEQERRRERVLPLTSVLPKWLRRPQEPAKLRAVSGRQKE